MGEVIRRTKGGKFVGFYLRWYENGKRRQLASHQPTHAEARKMLLQIESRLARGEPSAVHRLQPCATITALVERFLAEYQRPRIKDIERYRANARPALRHVTARLGHLRVDQVQHSDVAKLRDALARIRKPGTVRKILLVFSAACAWAMREGLASSNPCAGVEKPTPQSDPDFLTASEVRALLSHAEARAADSIADQIQYARVLLAVHVGLRKGELCGLRWRDIDLATCRLTVARSYRSTPKSGKARHLRLPAVSVPVLRALSEICPKTDDGVVFPRLKRHGEWSMSDDSSDMLGLPNLLRDAGVRVLPNPWHALRHTFASHFIMQGGNILTLSKILGHSDVKVTLVYAHLAPDFLGNELDRLRF